MSINNLHKSIDGLHLKLKIKVYIIMDKMDGTNIAKKS